VEDFKMQLLKWTTTLVVCGAVIGVAAGCSGAPDAADTNTDSSRSATSASKPDSGAPGALPPKSSLRCPIDGCEKPDPPDPPPRPLIYPAQGWTVITASQDTINRGIQWWAYQWSGSHLAVKGYAPTDFGSGVEYDPSQVSLYFDVHSMTSWSANDALRLDFQYPNGTQEYGALNQSQVDTTLGDDGVIRQTISLTYPGQSTGYYEDDGSGSQRVGGDETIKAVAPVAIFSFLNDFQASGGLLMPPSPDTSMSCDESCAGGAQLYFDRANQFMANRALRGHALSLDSSCWYTAGYGAGCAIGSIVIAYIPVLSVLSPIVGSLCGKAVGAAIDCLTAEIGSKDQLGPCTVSTDSIGVIGPDGSWQTIAVKILSTLHCDF
jgi:hypothetical protein